MNDHNQKALRRWWQKMFLPNSELKSKGMIAAPSVYKAQLKRSGSLIDAMMCEGFRNLWFSLDEKTYQSNHPAVLERWALIAQSLVFVKNDSAKNLATAAGEIGKHKKPIVSELRFLQLGTSRNAEEFARHMRRVLQQLDGEVSVISLAKDIEWWFKQRQYRVPREAAERVEVRWAMDYYRAALKK